MSKYNKPEKPNEYPIMNRLANRDSGIPRLRWPQWVAFQSELREALAEIDRLREPEGDRTVEVVGDDGKVVARLPEDDPKMDCCGASIFGEHEPDCSERCRHCGSEGSDLDHKEGCPTIGTCACFAPNQIDLADAHEDDGKPLDMSWTVWVAEHMREFHPGVKTR